MNMKKTRDNIWYSRRCEREWLTDQQSSDAAAAAID